MTRSTLKRTLRRAYGALFFVLAVALAAKFAKWAPGVTETSMESFARDLYEYLRDMALVLVTVIAAFLANVFRKRSNFIENLEEEWRGIVRTKMALYAYCQRPYPSTDDYVAAFGRISEAIDNMRIVYRNAGETRDFIGLYPYAPLHDMRRALQSIDPRKKANVTAEDRKLAQDAILESFYALRESFLEEMDLPEPSHPLLISGGRRLKAKGAASPALAVRKAQWRGQSEKGARPDVEDFLTRINREEQADKRDAGLSPPPAAEEPPETRVPGARTERSRLPWGSDAV